MVKPLPDTTIISDRRCIGELFVLDPELTMYDTSGGALLGPAIVEVDEHGSEGPRAMDERKAEGRVAGQEVEGRALPAAVPLQGIR